MPAWRQTLALRICSAFLAPLVAVVWIRLLGLSFQVNDLSSLEITLGLCVWMIYTTDHYLDFLSAWEFRITSRAQRIYSILVLCSLAVVCGTNLILACQRLERPVLYAVVPLCLAVLAYLARVHLRTFGDRLWPREILVGILFAMGVVTPIAALAFDHERLWLLYPFITALMVLNCCGIKIWALPHPEKRHPATQWVGLRMTMLGSLLSVGALLARQVTHGPVLLAVAISAAMLALLPIIGIRWSNGARAVAVDLALCSPLLLPFFW